MAPYPSTLAWKIPWMEEPGRLQSMGSLRVGHTERLHFPFSLSCIGEGNGNPLQCSCLENPGMEDPGGLPSLGSHRVGHDWSDLAAAAAPYLGIARILGATAIAWDSGMLATLGQGFVFLIYHCIPKAECHACGIISEWARHHSIAISNLFWVLTLDFFSKNRAAVRIKCSVR